MSFNIKTLIVFDTNSLRSTEAGAVAYSSFEFGRPFHVIEEFVTEQRLATDIHIAIPAWTIEELKDQKQRQYKSDIVEFQKLAKRLSGLPHLPELTLPETEFDCAVYVEEKALNYLSTKNIKLLDIKEELANTVLRNMMTRVMKEENSKSPFAHSGKYKDAGFKDNLVWESLMNYKGVAEYDKVIFLTKDGDYRNCEVEFREKWERHIAILKDENIVISQLSKDYDNYIEFRKFYDYSEKDYFRLYLQQQLNDKTYIQLEDDIKIENYKIENYCERVENNINENTQEEEYIIHSKVFIAITRNKNKESVPVDAQILMNDVFEIDELLFEPGIYT